MDFVNITVKRRPMDQPMDAKEMEFMQQGDEEPKADEPNRIRWWVQPGDIAVRIKPKRRDLPYGPDRNAKAESPKQVVAQLRPKGKSGMNAVGPIAVEFEIGPLRATPVKPVMLGADDEDYQANVA